MNERKNERFDIQSIYYLKKYHFIKFIKMNFIFFHSLGSLIFKTLSILKDGKIVVKKKRKDGKKNSQFLKTDASGRAPADVWLKHGDTIALKNLPLDAKYSIAEEKTKGYETTVKANGADVSGISECGVQADSIVFVNSSGDILPTGMHRVYALAIIAATGTAVVLVMRRRKKKKMQERDGAQALPPFY